MNLINTLNNFTDKYFQWQTTKARKEHIDEYGIKINIGNTYCKRLHTKYHNDIFKLSEDSMDKLLFLIVQ